MEKLEQLISRLRCQQAHMLATSHVHNDNHPYGQQDRPLPATECSTNLLLSGDMLIRQALQTSSESSTCSALTSS